MNQIRALRALLFLVASVSLGWLFGAPAAVLAAKGPSGGTKGIIGTILDPIGELTGLHDAVGLGDEDDDDKDTPPPTPTTAPLPDAAVTEAQASAKAAQEEADRLRKQLAASTALTSPLGLSDAGMTTRTNLLG